MYKWLLNRSLWRTALTITLAGIVGGCASIQKFRVTPRTACSGDSVVADWTAKGQARLNSSPVLDGTGPQPSTGTKSFTVREPTHFALTAQRLFKDATAEADVAVAPESRSYGTIASCDTGQRLITAQLTLADQLSGRFRIDTVSNPLERTLRVTKSGTTVSIDAHGQNAAFRGQPVHGDWVLASPLRPEESCDAAMRSIRQRLQVGLELACGR